MALIKNEIQVCSASEDICNCCCATKYMVQVHLALKSSFSCVSCLCCRCYCSHSRLCWSEETRKHLERSGHSKRKQRCGNRHQKKILRHVFFSPFLYRLSWSYKHDKKKAGASSICFQKRLFAANLDSFVQRKRKFRNNRSITAILIIKSSIWNMELYYGVLQRNGVTEGTTEADGQCSVMDGECSSRSWQRATYCHSQLLDSLPDNGIIFQKEIRAKKSLEIHTVHFFKLLVLPDSRFFL